MSRTVRRPHRLVHPGYSVHPLTWAAYVSACELACRNAAVTVSYPLGTLAHAEALSVEPLGGGLGLSVLRRASAHDQLVYDEDPRTWELLELLTGHFIPGFTLYTTHTADTHLTFARLRASDLLGEKASGLTLRPHPEVP